MRDGFGMVRNNTSVDQCFGMHIVPAHGFGELPSEVVTSLLRHPMVELTVLQPEVGPQVFLNTSHVPWGVRFRERAQASGQG